MRTKVYKYVGTIAQIMGKTTPSGLREIDFVLHDMRDDDKAPTRLTCFGKLAEYIWQLENTDDEERYLTWEWYYDFGLELQFAVIPSTAERPAKILAATDWGKGLLVYGPEEHITTAKPAPMEREEYADFRAWRNEHYEL